MALVAATAVGAAWGLAGCGDDSTSGDSSTPASTAIVRGVEQGKCKAVQIDLSGKPLDSYWVHQASGTWDERAFKDDGSRFRRALLILEGMRDPKTRDLQCLYDELKAKNKGIEYSKNGEVFDPKDGEEYWIIDPPSSEPGIALRNEPKDIAKFFNHKGYVYEDSIVKIIGEPIEEVDTFGRKHTWYKVRVIQKSANFENPAIAEVGDEGYFERKWLDEKVEQTAGQVN
ncbi:hypothetical protein HY024_03935 [Candidatus Curtissbacteria bacterium]|nr:hypothetical protein [Candidatus Curtissbacteria bacterium]